MRNFTVELKSLYNLSGGRLNAYISDPPFDNPVENYKRPAVIVVAGGGYYFVSKREQEPVGNYFLYQGYQVFILDYTCAPDGVKYPEQLYELGASVDYIRKNAAELLVDPEKIFCVGFSAGGHLVCDLSVEYEKVDAELAVDSKPTAVGLCYPVITPDGGHMDSFDNLLKGYDENEKAELLESMKLDKRVTKNTPPAFIWATAKDNCVPPVNSLAYAQALSQNGVNFELHIYPNGTHGLSSCTEVINAPSSFLAKNGTWIKDCGEFFKSI